MYLAYLAPSDSLLLAFSHFSSTSCIIALLPSSRNVSYGLEQRKHGGGRCQQVCLHGTVFTLSSSWTGVGGIILAALYHKVWTTGQCSKSEGECHPKKHFLILASVPLPIQKCSLLIYLLCTGEKGKKLSGFSPATLIPYIRSPLEWPSTPTSSCECLLCATCITYNKQRSASCAVIRWRWCHWASGRRSNLYRKYLQRADYQWHWKPFCQLKKHLNEFLDSSIEVIHFSEVQGLVIVDLSMVPA